jgi:hypothetical protein
MSAQARKVAIPGDDKVKPSASRAQANTLSSAGSSRMALIAGSPGVTMAVSPTFLRKAWILFYDIPHSNFFAKSLSAL